MELMKVQYVEVSGHNLRDFSGLRLLPSFLPFNKMLFINNLEFSSLVVDCFEVISETIGMVWFTVRFSSF
jgi:hypothetical protein